MWHKVESLKRTEIQLRKYIHEGKNCLLGIFLNSDRCGRDQTIVGGVISGLVVLVSTKKQAEHTMGSKTVSSTAPWVMHSLLLLGSCNA